MENPKIGVGVGVMLLKEGKILLGLRSSNPEIASSSLKGEGTWCMPGGKLEIGEKFEEAAKREVMEECGIVLNSVKVICINNDIKDGKHFVTIGTFSDDFSGEPKVLEEAITEWKWFSIDDLPTPLFFPSAKILENYLNKEFYISDL